MTTTIKSAVLAVVRFAVLWLVDALSLLGAASPAPLDDPALPALAGIPVWSGRGSRCRGDLNSDPFSFERNAGVVVFLVVKILLIRDHHQHGKRLSTQHDSGFQDFLRRAC